MREVLPGSEQKRPIRFDTPGNCLPRDRAESPGRKALWALSILLRHPNHLTNQNDDLGEGEPTLLLGRYCGLYRKAKRTDESEQPLVLFGDETVGLPGIYNWFFRGAPLAVRMASPEAPGYCLTMEADRTCGLVGTSRT